MELQIQFKAKAQLLADITKNITEENVNLTKISTLPFTDLKTKVNLGDHSAFSTQQKKIQSDSNSFYFNYIKNAADHSTDLNVTKEISEVRVRDVEEVRKNRDTFVREDDMKTVKMIFF